MCLIVKLLTCRYTELPMVVMLTCYHVYTTLSNWPSVTQKRAQFMVLLCANYVNLPLVNVLMCKK